MLDEAHTIVTDNHREVMSKAFKVMKFKVPVVLLSATLPVRLRLAVTEKIGLPEHKVIQAPSNRTEHEYSVFLVGDSRETLVAKTASFIMRATKHLTGTQRAIVFATSRDDGFALTKYVPRMEFIHSKVESEATRNNIMTNWEAGTTGGWLLGTSSLIQGVDYHDVHLVVFMGVPWGMVNFVQGAGRSGRNGSRSRVVLLHAGWHPKIKGADEQCQKEMNAWVETSNQCRRIGISDCMDGVPVTCESLPGAAKCDVCKPVPDLAEIVNLTPLPKKGEVVVLRPLAAPVRTAPRTEAPTQLDVPMLRPRSAPEDVLLNSDTVINRFKARRSIAKKCLSSLSAFGPKCIVCFFYRKDYSTQHKMCLNSLNDPEMSDAYQWLRPKRRGDEVRSHQMRPTRHRLTLNREGGITTQPTATGVGAAVCRARR